MIFGCYCLKIGLKYIEKSPEKKVYIMKNHYILNITVIIALIGLVSYGENWGNWRGPNTNGTALEGGEYPGSWTADSATWKAELPGKGFSCPIVWDNMIYITAGVDGQDTILAYDMAGKLVWQKQLGEEKKGKHPNGSGSNSSVVTDGKTVFVFFNSGRFAAFTMDGTMIWQTNLFEKYGKDERFFSYGTSPVLTEKYVVMTDLHDGDSWVAALDKANGEEVWKISRNYETPKENSQSYFTPLVYDRDGKEMLLIWGGEHLSGHDADTGKMVWSCGGYNPEKQQYWPVIASPVVADGVAIMGFARADRNLAQLHGVKLGGEGDVSKTHKLWDRDDTGTFIPTPAVYDGKAYVVHDRGTIECIDPQIGKSIWSGEFPKYKGNFYPSPVIAGGYIYCIRESGMVYVLKLSDKFELVSEIDMGDKIIATPAAVDGKLIIRTEKYLYCIN